MALDKQLNVKLATQELERVERLRERIQQREGQRYRVTQRVVILEALDALESYLDRLDKDKERRR